MGNEVLQLDRAGVTDSLSEALFQFAPVSLQEMDNVKLMDRTDTKFLFKMEQLPYFLEELSNSYRVLEVSSKRICRYETLYFDTPNFQLYLHHQNGKLNRYKVRYRRYIESDLSFFEIKFKNNKGRTIKNRVKKKAIEYSITGKAENLLRENTNLDPALLEPKIWVNYSRITLVNTFLKERVTIDVNLSFKNTVASSGLENLVIAEVKQESCASSPFIDLMKKNHIRRGSISKYCLGIASLYKDVKQNNYKPKLLNLNKILYGTATTC